MTFQQLAKELCKIEGKKKQMNIAQVSEVLSALSKLLRQQPEDVLSALIRSAGYKWDTVIRITK